MSEVIHVAFGGNKKRPDIICLCGSTRFMQTFHEIAWELTLQRYIVLSVGVCKHAEDHGGEALGQEVVDKLDELHLRKIDMADMVWVLNVDKYIGDSTRKEVEYAKLIGKPIYYLSEMISAYRARQNSGLYCTSLFDFEKLSIYKKGGGQNRN